MIFPLVYAQEMCTYIIPPLELTPSPSGLGQMLLILSGDVELNPGPENSEYKINSNFLSFEAINMFTVCVTVSYRLVKSLIPCGAWHSAYVLL